MLLTPTCQGRSYAHYTTLWCFKKSGMSKINSPKENRLATTLWRHTRKAINKLRGEGELRETSEKHPDVRKAMFSGGTRCWVCQEEDCLKLSGSIIQGRALMTRETYNLATRPLRMIKAPTSYLLWEPSQPISPSSFRSSLENKGLFIQVCGEHL